MSRANSRVLQTEYLVISFDDESKKAHLSLRQAEILNELAKYRGSEAAKVANG